MGDEGKAVGSAQAPAALLSVLNRHENANGGSARTADLATSPRSFRALWCAIRHSALRIECDCIGVSRRKRHGGGCHGR
jgi:hypothetical protein